MPQLTSDTTSISIGTWTGPKNVLAISQFGTTFTIKAWDSTLVTDKTPFDQFTDASNAAYTTPALFLTAFKAAAYK